jgi:hypothetical protein
MAFRAKPRAIAAPASPTLQTRAPRTHGPARLLALAAAAFIHTAAPAQPEPAAETPTIARPSVAGRVVKIFDFEESAYNPSPVPLGWFRSGSTLDDPNRRTGFPHWNQAELYFGEDATRVAHGIGSVILPTRGGSAAIALDPGVVPIFASADYWVSAMVRTHGLAHARASLRASLMDASGAEIPGSVAYAPLVLAEEAWTPMGVEVVGVHPNAAYLRIELLLLQPSDAPGATRAPFQTFKEDVKGDACFDDVVIVQIPRVELTIDATNNVLEGDVKPVLHAQVRDLSGERLSIEVRVIDLNGNVVDQSRSALGVGQGSVTWSPKLPAFGWYRATMDVVGPNGRVGGTAADFVWVPAPAPTPMARTGRRLATGADRALGIAFTNLPSSFYASLPSLLEQANAGWATIDGWERADDEATITKRAASLRPVIDTLAAEGRSLVLALARTPASLAAAARRPSEDVWTILSRPDNVAAPYLAAITDPLGQSPVRWQVGAPGDDEAFWRTAADLRTAKGQIARHSAAPSLVVPTTPDVAWSAANLRALGDDSAWIVSVDDTLSPEGVGNLARALALPFRDSAAAPERVVLMRQADPNVYSMSETARRLALSIAEFWANGRDADHFDPRLSIALEQPWRIAPGRRPFLSPTPEFAVWRALAGALADRVVVAPFNEVPGIRGVVLAPGPNSPPGREGALLLWNVGATDNSFVESFLGDADLRIIDAFGNSRPAPSAAPRPGQTGRAVRIDVGEWPVLVEGVDVNLVRFLSRLNLDDAFLPSTGDVHTRHIELSNPWPQPVSGRVVILEPGGFESTGKTRDRRWRIGPRVLPFVIDPGQTVRLPFDISFAPSEEVGKHAMVLRVDVAADRDYGSVFTSRPLEIGLPGVRMDVTYSLQGSNSQDLIIEAVVANSSATPLTLDLTAFAPDLPRVKGIITELKNGNRATVRFPYPGGYAKLKGKRVIVTGVEPDGGRRLTASIQIE